MKTKSKKTALKAVLVTGLGLVIVLGLAGSSIVPNISSLPTAPDIASAGPVPCGDPTKPVPEAYRIYPHLSILADGASVTIPAGIGVEADCTRVIYTNDASGTIRVEPQAARAYTLGDFFAVWGQPFSAQQVGTFKADAGHALIMTVNGEPSSAFQNLVLQDKQQIVIAYATVAAAPSANSGTSSSSPFTVIIP